MTVESGIVTGEARRRIEEIPRGPIETPEESGSFELDQTVFDGGDLIRSCMIYTQMISLQTAFPVQKTKLVHAFHYAEPLGGSMAKAVVDMVDQTTEYYFLKVFWATKWLVLGD